MIAFGCEGANVTVADIGEARALETAELVRSAGGSAQVVVTDVSQHQVVEHLVDHAIAAYGAFEVLFWERRHHR